MNRKSVLALTVLSPFAGIPALAQDVFTTLDPVVLSAGMSPIAAGAYGRANTVITAEQMEARGIVSVQEALRSVPGVSVSSAGSAFTQVRIRGGEANHTLILIDGVEAAGGADEYVLSGLETANIDRIEVLRGPQSVYYGSNASTGVINIITRKGGLGTEYGGTAEVGSGWAASGYFSQRSERGGLSFTASRRDDHGYDVSGSDGEKDGILRSTIGASGDWLVTEDLKLGFTLRRSREDYDLDATNFAPTSAEDYILDDPNLTSRRDETTAQAFAEYSMLDGRLTHRLTWQNSLFKQSYDDGPVTRGETRSLKYRGSFGLDGQAVESSRQVISALVDWQEDSSSTAPEYERDTTSVAAEYRGSFGEGFDVQAGLRHDSNSAVEDINSWSVGLSYRIAGTGLRLHGSGGKGVVNPSYYQLFADDGWTQGNPGLQPETNEGFDLGVEWAFLDDRGLIDITYFDEDLTNAIAYVYGAAPDGSGRATYQNVEGKSPRKGVEVAGHLQATDDLSLRMNYTYLDARDGDGTVAVRRPRHELGLGATLAFLDGRAGASVDLRHVAGNYDTQFWTFEKAELPDFTTVDVAAHYDLTENVSLTGRVVNLFDEEYSEVWGYATRGRTAYVGVAAKW